MPGIGDGIKKKVQEYLDKGVFREVKDPFSAEKMKGLEDLGKIWGVGPEKASALYASGFTSIAKLKAHENKKGAKSVLTSLQKIGLKYYDDLKDKMTREEAAQLLKVV